ncbi:MAG TPA: plastocyanin/azurin family copper-binding protein [Gaiellaceae bacterium]|nr:plastocyanin/azurin family copper-binding protein [Gaiellaceae bacterium]
MTNRIRLLVITTAALGVLGSPAAAFAQTKLIATVGQNDAFTISLTNEAGATVRDIPAGAYVIEVRDMSSVHNFHLTGPGVEESTTVAFVGTATWTVTFQDKQTYRFVCDPHATSMRGSFTIGGGPPPPPPNPPPPKIPTLTATVGPGPTISLRTASGRRVTRLKAGRYRIVVRDRSRMHNFHLTGTGVNKRTLVGFRGTQTWTVTFRKGKVYRYVCDPHRRRMKGSFRAT